MRVQEADFAGQREREEEKGMQTRRTKGWRSRDEDPRTPHGRKAQSLGSRPVTVPSTGQVLGEVVWSPYTP